MSNKNQATTSNGDIELLQRTPLGMDADAFLNDFLHYHSRMLGRRTLRTKTPFAYQALVHATRDRLTERSNRTTRRVHKRKMRKAYYLSMEFLLGRLLRNALLNLESTNEVTEALERLGLDLEEVCELEHDAGLGNGGLGRLAACFLDSCATLGLPVVGYGIRYNYGMFHQRVENGYQVEEPDTWLRNGFPWEIERNEYACRIKFGGRTVSGIESDGKVHHHWVDTHDVMAVPYDVPVPGYDNEVVNVLRLWSAKATDAFDLEDFNAGDYVDAVAAKNEAENITMVLYPNAATENGRELRLRQQYFLASASLQDVLADHVRRYGPDLSLFAEKNCFQLNDTHPAVSVPELMRLLIDEHGLDWDEAWGITTETMAYTNHTLLPEALETWPVSMFERMLPRVLEIIYEINARFMIEVARRWPGDNDRLSRMSLIDEHGGKSVRMAYLAIVGSYSVNGVAALHSDLLCEGMFRDFYEMWPEKFNNKTNGVTPRRWLMACNPMLAHLIIDAIGPEWISDMMALKALEAHASDPAFQQRWNEVKEINKRKLADTVEAATGTKLSTDMLFDVQVKRIHEYKRQMLVVLHAVHLYDRILRGDGGDLVPRAIIIGGKAAPGYVMAKSIIKAINNVAEVINSNPVTQGKLRLIFFPDYNVSAMETICPGTDLSEQVSTAGKEASGTGNMKFMMNGAVTIGTLDGANVEIHEAVGDDDFYLFGKTVEEIAELRDHYDPSALIEGDEDFRRVMHLLESGHFNHLEPGILDAVLGAIRDPHDQWMTAADFRSYLDAQEAVNQAYKDKAAWTAMSIRNTANSGRFSTDRTIADYNREIWKLEPLPSKR